MKYTVDSVNWDDPKSKISDHFTVHEALWLPSWRVYHAPSEEEKTNILRMAASLDCVRKQLNRAVIVHCWIRPTKVNCPGNKKYHGKNYNKFVGSTSIKSAHITGEAVDYHVSGFSGPKGCNTIRVSLVPFLERYGMRMEDIDGAWIHNDIKPVKVNRFYKP